jgi:hypothetical protein
MAIQPFFLRNVKDTSSRSFAGHTENKHQQHECSRQRSQSYNVSREPGKLYYRFPSQINLLTTSWFWGRWIRSFLSGTYGFWLNHWMYGRGLWAQLLMMNESSASSHSSKWASIRCFFIWSIYCMPMQYWRCWMSNCWNWHALLEKVVVVRSVLPAYGMEAISEPIAKWFARESKGKWLDLKWSLCMCRVRVYWYVCPRSLAEVF